MKVRWLLFLSAVVVAAFCGRAVSWVARHNISPAPFSGELNRPTALVLNSPTVSIRGYDFTMAVLRRIQGTMVTPSLKISRRPKNDRLRIAGSAGQYLLGVSPIAEVPGTAVYHDLNGNAAFDRGSDELIAILFHPRP